MTLLAALYLFLWPPTLHPRWPIPASYRARAVEAEPWIRRAVELEGGDPIVLGAIGVNESALYRDKVGRHGERGPWQIHPRGAGVDCPDLRWQDDPADNARCAARHLDKGRSICKSLAAALSWYNGRGCKRDTAYSRRVMALITLAEKKQP